MFTSLIKFDKIHVTRFRSRLIMANNECSVDNNFALMFWEPGLNLMMLIISKEKTVFKTY
jgi:hypothetical protein